MSDKQGFIEVVRLYNSIHSGWSTFSSGFY